VIGEQPSTEEKPAGDSVENDAENDDTKEAGGAEVVDLTPAQLAEKIQEDQDPASA
jgi:hypothetical protein